MHLCWHASASAGRFATGRFFSVGGHWNEPGAGPTMSRQNHQTQLEGLLWFSMDDYELT